MELERLAAIVAEVLHIEQEQLTEDMTYVDDLGADSLDLYQIIMGIEEEFDVEIDHTAAENMSTIGDTVKAIQKALQ